MNRLFATLTAVVLTSPTLAQQPSPGAAPLDHLCAATATRASPIESTLNLLAQVNSTSQKGDRSVKPSLRERSCGNWVSPWYGAVWVNTAAAHADRDGAVWQGRGITGVASGGVRLRRELFELVIRPVLVVSQNASFVASSRRDSLPFGDPYTGSRVDLPVRFGSGTYFAIEPGESRLRLGSTRIGGGFSTGTQVFGPAEFYPLLLSAEGAGYPRIFLDGQSVSIGIGQVSAEWQIGFLESSGYSAATPGARSRVASAARASITPSGLPALSVGGARFFHVRRGPGSISWSTATLPFSGLVKRQSRDLSTGGFNQLASAFARLAVPGTGAVMYGEFLREDHNVDIRDLTTEPDHANAYLLGFSHAWRAAHGLTRVAFERANGRISHLQRVRQQDVMYMHGTIFEGHSHRGQALGSSAIIGGGGTAIAWTRVSRSTSWHAEYRVEGARQSAEGGTWNGRIAAIHAIRVVHHLLLGSSMLGLTMEVDTQTRTTDATNITLGLSLQR